MNETAFEHHPTDVEYLERMHKKEDKRHRRATKNMRKVFAACMNHRNGAPIVAQVEFVMHVARVAPTAIHHEVATQWMKRTEVLRCLSVDDCTLLVSLGVWQ